MTDATTDRAAGPVLSNDLFSISNRDLQHQVAAELEKWMDGFVESTTEKLRLAYAAGLKDGYIQGIADGHRGQL